MSQLLTTPPRLARMDLSKGLGAAVDLAALRRQSHRLLWHLFSFETAFILYLFAGAYKTDPRFDRLFPIDPSILFLGLTAALGLVIIWREGIYRPGLYYLSFYLLFAFWAVLTTIWSPSHIFAREEAIIVFIQNSWSIVCGGIIIANRRIRVYRFLLMFLLFATVISIGWLERYQSIFIYVNNGSLYHLAARVFTMAMIICFVGFVYMKGLNIDRFVLIGLFIICSLALLTTGARGYTISVFAVLCLPGLISTRFGHGKLLIHRSQPIMIVTILVVAVGVLYLYAAGELPWTLVRMLSFVGEQDGRLGMFENQRFNFYSRVIDFWTRAPLFGVGLGGFGPLMFGVDGRLYPHNIILQILSELGLVGLALFLPVLIIPFRRLSFARLWNEPVLLCIFLLTLNNLVYSMFSGDLWIGEWLVTISMLLMRPIADEVAAREMAQGAVALTRFS